MAELKISNSSKSSVESGKWKNPGASFYNKLLEYSNWKELIRESYLTSGKINNDPHDGTTPFSRSECKYPHHTIKDDKLVVSKPGVLAAYKRARQQGVFTGKLKSHLMKHIDELGITVHIDEAGDVYLEEEAESMRIIEENFNSINLYLMERTGINLFPTDVPMYEAIEHDLEREYYRKEREKNRMNRIKATPDNLIADPNDTPTSNKDEPFVPIFGIAKSYSDSLYLADGRPKNKSQLGSITFGHVISKLTFGDFYSHATCAFDEDLEEMYSFESKGFVSDSIKKDGWLATKSIYICVMFVKKSDKERMHRYCEWLVANKDKTKYAYANIIRGLLGIPVKTDTRYFCSAFASYILQCSNPKNLHRDYGVQRPEDMTILPRAFYVANVTDAIDFEKRKPEIKARIRKIYNDHIEEIKEYNNQLPKMMLISKVRKLRTLDKILDWIMGRGGNAYA